MVLTTPQPGTLASCQHLLQGQAKILADRLFGNDGPPPNTTLQYLEHTVDTLSLQLRRLVLELLLRRQAEAMHQALPPALRHCPACGNDTLAREPQPRLLHCRSVSVAWVEPQRYCRQCRKAYFPQSRSLGIDTGHYSTGLLDLICYAGANKPSFREASVDLAKMAGQPVHEKQVERLSKRIGLERLAERQQQVEAFAQLPLAERKETLPAGVTAPGADVVAVVMADAGMLQLRDEPVADQEVSLAEDAGAASAAAADDFDVEKPASKHWHEDKVGLVLTMTSAVSASDPCPEIPATFVTADKVGKIVRGLKKSAALRGEEPEELADAAAAEVAAATEPPEYEGPKLQTRQVVASRQSWPAFGVTLACQAWLAGFARAPRRAFVADGAGGIWGVWSARFSSYEPILDFIHALTYVYTAAKIVGPDPAEGWRLYAEWIRWVWQGQVALVIAALQQWQQEHGPPEKGEAKTTPRSVVAGSLRYLQNNQSRMKYDEYRKAGLPLVSSLVESMVKQVSRRVKGTEKFWGEEGASALLQLRGDYLSDGDVMASFWQRRQAAATGHRPYRSQD